MRAALLLLCLLAAPAGAEPGRLERVQAVLPEIDKMYADLAEKEHLPGLAYGVVLDGKLIHVRTLGLANLDDKIPVTKDSLFRVASMTKSFVVMAALKLRDEGKLKLDDPVSKYLPALRGLRLPTSDSPPLTIAMLMTMSTGLPEDNPWGDRQMTVSNAAFDKLFRGGLSFSTAPGTGYEYSNLGFIMLGKLVSKVAGMRYQDYISAKILKPLGMHSTVWEYGKVPKDKLALGYRWLDKAWVAEPILHDGDGAAMGGLISTIDDYGRYIAFHLDAWPARDGAETGPLKRASVREMHMPRVFGATIPENQQVTFYGYGMRWTRDFKNLATVGHSGGLPGFGSQYRFAPEYGIGVVAFTNLRYGPVYQPTIDALGTLVVKAKLPIRPAPGSDILTRRAVQVAQLIQSWDEALGKEIAADNFFLDYAREEWIAKAGAAFANIGKVTAVGPVRPLNALRGSFTITGELGELDVSFTLTPEQQPKLQELDLRRVPVVVVRQESYSILGREMATVGELTAWLKAQGIKKVAVRVASDDDYTQIGKLIYGCQRVGIELKLPDM
ncbi:MAG: serine hydrolase domain-containing protein [Pseudomonadota bacterium]